jgi:hypothetical protein
MVGSLFYDTLQCLDYVAPVIRWEVNDDELHRIWQEAVVASQHSPGWTEENHENVRQDSRGRDLNPGPHETGVLTTHPRRLVRSINEHTHTH